MNLGGRRMKTLFRKTVTLVLCMVLCISLLSASALAGNETTDSEKIEASKSAPVEGTVPASPAALFTDVSDPSAYYYEPVYWALENGIITGKTETTFWPNDPCTRAQAITFLWRMMGEPEPVIMMNPFNDVEPTDSSYKAILWAYYNDITDGMAWATFSPNKVCTRSQYVTFMWRAAGSPTPTLTENPFSDVKKTDFYYDAVLWALENGISTGKTSTKFYPNDICSRGQIVTFLYRARDYMEKE